MATTTAPAPKVEPATAAPPRPNWIDRNHFWLRRLHSLMGIIPIGAFLLFHYYENGAIFYGAGAYDTMAGEARGVRYLALIEIFLIFLPILYHAIYGLYITSYARNNLARYGYGRNKMFVFQRVSGVVLVLFLLYHVWTFRLTEFWTGDATTVAVAQAFSVFPIFVFYLLGVISAGFHLGNGLWTFPITWGFTIGARSQRIWQVVSVAFSVLLSGIGVAIAVAFTLQGGGFRWWF